MTDILSSRRAVAILLIEGIVSVSLQMIALRQIVPFVGSNVTVTSIVVTGFLAALAIGYRRGGRIEKNIPETIERNFLIVAGLTGLGLSYVAAGLFFESWFSVFRSNLVAVTVYVAVLLIPIIYLLAQTVVLLVNAVKAERAAQQAGDALNVSTWGNVIGGLVTTLIIMVYLGVAWAITLNVVLLIAAACLIPSPQSRLQTKVLVSVPIVVLTAVLNVGYERYTFLQTNGFSNYRIVPMADGASVLDINSSSASRTSPEGIGHEYLEHFETRAFKGDTALHPKKVLVLGAGGYTFGIGYDLSDVHLTFVDIDPALPEVGAEFVGVETIPHRVITSDARAYLLSTDETYDLIVLDTFSHLTSVPSHLLTLEYFRLVRSRLNDNGAVYVNVIMRQQPTVFRRGFDNTIRAAFSQCSTHLVSRPLIPVVNMLYECQKSALDSNRVIYRDGNLRASLDSGAR